MTHNLFLTTEIDILVLLLVACLAAIAFKSVNFPYTVGLVIVGLVLSSLAGNFEVLEIVNTFKLSEELILFIFVPPLIFESALNMDSRLLLRNLPPVLVLAVPGLLISTAIVGTALAWLTPLSLGQALLFGSLISATDPVAVIALFKELGAPKQLTVLVEGESLFNDATAIVTFNIILATVTAGQLGGNDIKQGIIAFLVSFVGGITVGAIFGYLMRWTMNLAQNNSLVLATITTITAYAAFLIAEEIFEVSPVMAVVSAGLVIGWYKSNRLDAEAEQIVASKALAIEQQVYNELQDRGFVSKTVLAGLNSMMNLKSDALQAGNLTPELPLVEPLEVRIANWLVQLSSTNPWIQKVKDNLTATKYEYLIFVAYSCEQVSLRLRHLSVAGNVPETALETCASSYEKTKHQKILQAQAIAEVRNLTRLWSRVDFTIEVAYENDPDEVLTLLEAVAQEMYHSSDWQDKLPSPPEILGIEQLSHTGMLVRVWLKTAPLQQWLVGREYRLRVRRAFAKHNIAIGRPQWINYGIPLDSESHK